MVNTARKKVLIKVVKWFALSVISLLFIQCSSSDQKNSVSGNKNNSPDFEADIDIVLTATTADLQLLPGQKTRVYTYKSKLLKGEDGNLEQINDTYLGPIIRVKPGQKIRIRFKNQLPRESVIHWHGLHIPPEMDGHPMHAIKEGEQYIYEFKVNNRPGTYWFHPHPDKITGFQVYYGLAGMFIIEDLTQNLPTGEFDKPFIIQDRTFDPDNQLIYLQNNPMAQMQGFLGEKILINGKANHQMDVKKSAYRFRVLNGSNSRIYKLAWSDASEIIVIGTDGGLLSKPVNKPYLMLAPGERIDIWKDFSGYQNNDELLLKSLSFNDGTSMGMGRMMRGNSGMMGGRSSTRRRQQMQSVPNGTEMDLLSFTVIPQDGHMIPLPVKLSETETIHSSNAVNADNTRKFHFSFEHMQWVINGEKFELTEVADWEKVKLNTTEIWEFINGNEGGGMMGNMMQMPHPLHLHGLQFQIIDRDISGVNASTWRTVKDGFLDEGWQDTFLLLPGMKVQVIMKFEDYTGIYVYHCHNLEHEDMGMMRNYEVIAE